MFEIFSFKHEISSVALLINHFCFDYLVFFIADNLIKNLFAPNHYFFITKVCNLLRYKLFWCLYSLLSFSSILFSCSRDKTLTSCFLVLLFWFIFPIFSYTGRLTMSMASLWYTFFKLNLFLINQNFHLYQMDHFQLFDCWRFFNFLTFLDTKNKKNFGTKN